MELAAKTIIETEFSKRFLVSFSTQAMGTRTLTLPIFYLYLVIWSVTQMNSADGHHLHVRPHHLKWAKKFGALGVLLATNRKLLLPLPLPLPFPVP